MMPVSNRRTEIREEKQEEGRYEPYMDDQGVRHAAAKEKRRCRRLHRRALTKNSEQRSNRRELSSVNQTTNGGVLSWPTTEEINEAIQSCSRLVMKHDELTVGARKRCPVNAATASPPSVNLSIRRRVACRGHKDTTKNIYSAAFFHRRFMLSASSSMPPRKVASLAAVAGLLASCHCRVVCALVPLLSVCSGYGMESPGDANPFGAFAHGAPGGSSSPPATGRARPAAATLLSMGSGSSKAVKKARLSAGSTAQKTPKGLVEKYR